MFKYFADLVVFQWLGLPHGDPFSTALNFFVYGVPKISVLMMVAVFVVSIVRSYIPPEKTKKYLSHRRTFVGNILAALIGILTPFCSCSAVPLFIGFMEAGVPLGVTFSFLVSSPMRERGWLDYVARHVRLEGCSIVCDKRRRYRYYQWLCYR